MAPTEMAGHRQILVTSHSPELLDSLEISDDQLVSVVSEGGRSIVSGLDPKTRSVLRQRLFTAGELLKRGQLDPDKESAVVDPEQLTLFDGEVE